MPNLTNQSIGRYHIFEQLGQGGMATVYKAYDTRLEREVAVKVIRADAFPPAVLDRVLKRFEREARSLARLSDPYIVKVYDFGEHEGSPYLVMELHKGGTLKERLGKPVDCRDAASLLLPVAKALAYAHAHGVLHRDVKPSNILINEREEAVLTDFGIAKLLEGEEGHTLTGTGIGVGTPEYMAPEQGLGKDVDGRSDVYGLGVVLYEMVTGRKPYEAETPLAVLLKQVHDPLPRPKQFIPDLPDEVERVIFKALAKKPEDRYETMAAFAAALEGLVHVQPVSAPVPQPHEQKLAQGTPAPEHLPLHIPVQPSEPETMDMLAPQMAKQQTLKRKMQPRKLWSVFFGFGTLVLITILILLFDWTKRNPLELALTETPVDNNWVSEKLHPTGIVNATAQESQPVSTLVSPTNNQQNWKLGELIFSEDFEDSIANGFNVSWGAFKIIALEDGNHVWESTRPSSAEMTLPTLSSDYAVQAKIMQKSTGKGYPFIEARMEYSQPCSRNYGAYLSFIDGWLNLVERASNCEELRIGGLFDNSQVSLRIEQWYTLRLEVKDHRARVYLDDKLIAQDEDTTSILTSNQIGIATCCEDLLPFTFYYDDINVWLIEP